MERHVHRGKENKKIFKAPLERGSMKALLAVLWVAHKACWAVSTVFSKAAYFLIDMIDRIDRSYADKRWSKKIK